MLGTHANIRTEPLTNEYRDSVHGLNLNIPESAKELIKPWEERDDEQKFVESNVDDQVTFFGRVIVFQRTLKQMNQLMIHIPFMENVRIKSILLKVGTSIRYNEALQINIISLTKKAEENPAPATSTFTSTPQQSSTFKTPKRSHQPSNSPF